MSPALVLSRGSEIPPFKSKMRGVLSRNAGEDRTCCTKKHGREISSWNQSTFSRYGVLRTRMMLVQ